MEITITSNIDKVSNRLKLFPEIAELFIKEKLKEAIEVIHDAVQVLTPIGIGPEHLSRNLETRIFQVGRKIRASLSTPVYYGIYVELGTRPHFPPLPKILEWVEIKLGYAGEEAEDIAWAICKKIGDVGSEGVHMFEQGFDDAQPQMLQILDQIPYDIIKELSKQ